MTSHVHRRDRPGHLSDETIASPTSVGRESLTQRHVDRRAGGARAGDHSMLDAAWSGFVQRDAKKTPTAGPSAEDRGGEGDLPRREPDKENIQGRVVGHEKKGEKHLRLQLGLGWKHGVHAQMKGYLTDQSGKPYKHFEMTEVLEEWSYITVEDDVANMQLHKRVVINPSATKPKPGGKPVQKSHDQNSGLDDNGIRAAAAHGISGGGGSLPHLDAIQRSFGSHDVSGVRAHVGGAASEASEAMGAHAYATGNDVAFAQSPSLFLAAHEAAHVVQQRAGVQLSSAVGQEGDAYEQHADAVAARVVAGESAEGLLSAGAGGNTVQRAVVQRDAKAGTDYRKHMPEITAAVDEASTDVAETITYEKAPVGRHDERRPMEDGSNRTYKTSVASFGLMSGMSIDTAFARERRAFFVEAKQQDAKTSSATAANASLDQMIGNYAEDSQLLPEAELHYNTLVPMANLAYRSRIRLYAVDGGTGMKDKGLQHELSEKEQGALKGAVGAEAINAQASVKLAGERLHGARHTMIEKSYALASTVRAQAVKALETERDKATTDKAAINAKIAKVTKAIGYIEQAGTYIAGGAGFVNARLPGLTPGDPTGVDIRQDGFGTTEKVGKGIGGGASALGAAVTFGMNLYHHDKLAELDVTISRLNKEIAVYRQFDEEAKIREAHEGFKGATRSYKAAVDGYVAAVTDRRATMARLGAAADKGMRNSGNQEHVSRAMLKMSAALECQSTMKLALETGRNSQARLLAIFQKVNGHRGTRWGRAGEMYGANTLPHREGDGPDLKTLREMFQNTENWVQSATRVDEDLDREIQFFIEPTRGAAGWNDDF